MSDNTKKNVVWAIRLIVSAVFILSAVGKLSIDSPFDKPAFALTNFEKNFLVDGVGFGMGMAKILSRLLLGLEFSIAILLLLPYYTKKIVIPGTILLLSVFSVHLAIQAIGGDSSNCGCFGELIPMTPFQSLIKNIVTIGLLILPLTMLKQVWEEKANLNTPLHIGLVISLLMFIVFPQGGGVMNSLSTENSEETNLEDKSGYAEYFEDINEGNKLLCFFSPTCEHCQATGKRLTEMKKQFPGIIPEIRILFMDEAGDGSANDIKTYFEYIGTEYSYKVLSIEAFLPIFWQDRNFPGVKYLCDGEERVFFDGTEENEFKADKLLEEIRKEY